ncbi:MAG: alcohol dehydrogenase catalytic domain-containing protein [Gammaproteobacteria bacterium]|nr:alcohol dehydrogenase catalytic domain-containing protein [Gammaproteobacteria bacterium]
MRGLVLGATGLMRWDDLRVPEPGVGDALIRVRMAGICGTDLAMLNGYAGFAGVPGHEFVGEVVGAVDETWIGQRVVGSINIGCGACDECRDHGPDHCQGRRVLGIRGHDGAFAEYLTLPIANLYRVPDGLSDRQAVFVEPLAAALRVLDQVEVFDRVAGKRAAVIGPGRLGMLVAQVLRGAGADVLVIGRSEASLALPRELGFKAGLGSDIADLDLIVETSGTANGLDCALDWVRARGTVVLKSTYDAVSDLDLTRVVIKEIRLLGSRCGPFDRAMEWLSAGRVETEPLIDSVFPLERFDEAFRRAGAPAVRKVLFAIG